MRYRFFSQISRENRDKFNIARVNEYSNQHYKFKDDQK